MNEFIPVNEPLLDGNEKKYLAECIDTGWISSEGRFVKQFEAQLADYVGRKYAVSVTNGTAALELAIKALGIGHGDEVIMPSFTIISCAQAIVKVGATPVLIDAEYDSFNMNVSAIETKITPNTKAIMVVHVYGLPVDMQPVLELAKKYDLKVIEDAAEMLGQSYRGQPCGSFGDISTFSFYPNKHVTTGEGGMVLMDDETLFEQCKSLRNLCFSTDSSQRFIHEELGWNLRMTNLQAAVGVAQLEKIDKHIEKKRWIGQTYQTLLSDIECIQLPIESTEFADNIYWVFSIVLKNDMNAKEITHKLADKGIGSRPFFYPMHRQPVLKKMGLFTKEAYGKADKLYEKGFYIPSGLSLTDEQMKRVSEVLHEVLV